MLCQAWVTFHSPVRGTCTGPCLKTWRASCHPLAMHRVPGMAYAVHCGLLDNRRRDLLWSIARNAIVSNLKSLQWRLVDGLCRRTGCTPLESVSHVFLAVRLCYSPLGVVSVRLTASHLPPLERSTRTMILMGFLPDLSNN